MAPPLTCSLLPAVVSVIDPIYTLEPLYGFFLASPVLNLGGVLIPISLFPSIKLRSSFSS